MWIQIIKARLKPGIEAELGTLMERLRAAEQPNSGLIRSTTARDQKDPNTVYTIVTFESEEKARAREQDPRRQESLQSIRAMMAEIFDGPPEFTDLNVVAEHPGAS
jgi:quinol monooxygenase YgiN